MCTSFDLPATPCISSFLIPAIFRWCVSDAVKLEGGRRVAPHVQAIVDAGIAVVGHIGLTPQTASAQGGFGVRGRGVAAAMKLLDDAIAIQDAGACALVLEMVSSDVHFRNLSIRPPARPRAHCRCCVLACRSPHRVCSLSLSLTVENAGTGRFPINWPLK